MAEMMGQIEAEESKDVKFLRIEEEIPAAAKLINTGAAGETNTKGNGQGFRTSLDGQYRQQKLTDPIESFESVKSHFEKIQQNFNSMR